MPAFDAQRAAEVLVDAHLLGARRAAEKWGCTTRTIERYRGRLEEDAAFAQLYAGLLHVAERDWRTERLRFLRNGLAKLDELVTMARGPDHIDAVARAVKVVGELQVASDVLSGDRDADPTDPSAPATPGAGAAAAQAIH